MLRERLESGGRGKGRRSGGARDSPSRRYGAGRAHGVGPGSTAPPAARVRVPARGGAGRGGGSDRWGEEAEGSRLERKGGSGRLVFFLSLSPLLVYETSALSSSQLLHASQPRHARASAGLESRRLTCNAKAHAAACLPVLPLLHKSGKTAVISLPPSIHPSAFPRLVLLVFLYRNLYHLLPLPGTYYKSSEKDMYIRASTLLHISCPIGRLMLCHIRFLVM